MEAELTRAQEYIKQGIVLYEQDKFEDARIYFEKAAAEDQMNDETYILIAQTYIMQDDYAAARENLKKALLIDKKNGTTYFHLGNVEMLDGNMDAAKECFTKAISLGADSVQIYINLAAAEEERRDYAKAMTYYDKVLALDKYNADARLRKIQLFLLHGRMPEALKACDQMLETCPEVFEGYHYKVGVLCELNRPAEAKALLEMAIERFPDDADLYYDMVGVLQQLGESETALAMLEEKVPITEDNALEYHKRKAQLYMGMLRVDAALEELKPVYDAERDPESGYLLACIYMSREDYASLLEVTQQMVDTQELDSYYYAALYYRAIALQRLGRTADGEQALREANVLFRAECAKKPGQIELYMYRSMCHKELQEYQKAMDMIDYLLRAAPENGEVYLLRSQIYEELGEKEKAAADKAKAFEIQPQLRSVTEG